jgi:alpha-D-ribose 1-methylphosphonate 5-triphosphate synthase subunit PhnH
MEGVADMSGTVDLSAVGPGLAEPVSGSQAIFRACLDAMSRPGTVQVIVSDAEPPRGLGAAACAVLLSLLDQDTALWVEPSTVWRATDIAAYFRFHTGCTIAASIGDAEFVLASRFADLPALNTLRQGTPYFPEQGATLVLEVSALQSAFVRQLKGPGTTARSVLSAPDLNDSFLSQWQELRRGFPCGIDLFLTCGTQLCALPRTTKIGDR